MAEYVKAEAREILAQIESGKWNWVKVKRFDAKSYSDLKERYEALDKHHIEETQFLISVIQRLCAEIAGG